MVKVLKTLGVIMAFCLLIALLIALDMWIIIGWS